MALPVSQPSVTATLVKPDVAETVRALPTAIATQTLIAPAQTLEERIRPLWGNDWVKTIDVLRAYLAVGGSETDSAKRLLYDALIEYGTLLSRIGQPVDAVETWRQATEVDSMRPEATALIARLNGIRGEPSPTLSPSPTKGATPTPGRTITPTAAPTSTQVSEEASPTAGVALAERTLTAAATETVPSRSTIAAIATAAVRATRTAQNEAFEARVTATRQASIQQAQALAAALSTQTAARTQTKEAGAPDAKATYIADASSQLTRTAVASGSAGPGVPTPTAIPPTVEPPTVTPLPPTAVPATPTVPPSPTAAPTSTPIPVPTSTPVPAPTTTPVPVATVALQTVERKAPPQDAQLQNGFEARFEWNVSPGASKYRLQLWEVDNSNDLEYDILVDGNSYTLLIPDRIGPWMWRVRAVGADGRLGPISSNQNRFAIK